MESWLVWWKSNLPGKRMGGMGYGMLTDRLIDDPPRRGDSLGSRLWSPCSHVFFLYSKALPPGVWRLLPPAFFLFFHPLPWPLPAPARPNLSFLPLPSLSFKPHPWEPSWTSQKGDADFQQAPSVKWEIHLMRNLFKWEIPSQIPILIPSLLFLVWIRNVSQELSDPWGPSFSLRYCRKPSDCSQGAAGQTGPRISLWGSCRHSTELRIARHWRSLDHVLHVGPMASGVPTWMWQPPPGQGRIPGKTRWELLCSRCVYAEGGLVPAPWAEAPAAQPLPLGHLFLWRHWLGCKGPRKVPHQLPSSGNAVSLERKDEECMRACLRAPCTVFTEESKRHENTHVQWRPSWLRTHRG